MGVYPPKREPKGAWNRKVVKVERKILASVAHVLDRIQLRVWHQRILAAIGTALPAQFGGCGILAVVDSVIDLAGCDVDNEFAELERIARALESLLCHALNMAW